MIGDALKPYVRHRYVEGFLYMRQEKDRARQAYACSYAAGTGQFREQFIISGKKMGPDLIFLQPRAF